MEDCNFSAENPPDTDSPHVLKEAEGDLREKRQKKKRKRKRSPNIKEQMAISRHKGVRASITAAFSAFQSLRFSLPSDETASQTGSLLFAIPRDTETAETREDAEEAVVEVACEWHVTDAHMGGAHGTHVGRHVTEAHMGRQVHGEDAMGVDFVKLGAVWQSSLVNIEIHDVDENGEPEAVKLYNQLIENPREVEVMASACERSFVLPPRSRFLMSDITAMGPLLPSSSEEGYNLIVIDPPWENKSAIRKAPYPVLPNRHMLGVPLRQLAHAGGALVALWVTNREKIRAFVESELLPSWGVSHVATWHWLKVTKDGEMLSPLDLAHHRPYEPLLLGYIPPVRPDSGVTADGFSMPPETRRPPQSCVVVSPQREHSRKPLLESILSQYLPGQAKPRPLELFARNLLPGWTSWGNEPLRFQEIPQPSK